VSTDMKLFGYLLSVGHRGIIDHWHAPVATQNSHPTRRSWRRHKVPLISSGVDTYDLVWN
jgi:hypothetical protein